MWANSRLRDNPRVRCPSEPLNPYPELSRTTHHPKLNPSPPMWANSKSIQWTRSICSWRAPPNNALLASQTWTPPRRARTLSSLYIWRESTRPLDRSCMGLCTSLTWQAPNASTDPAPRYLYFYMYIYIYVYIHIYMCMYGSLPLSLSLSLSIYLSICLHRIYISIYLYVYIYIYRARTLSSLYIWRESTRP